MPITLVAQDADFDEVHRLLDDIIIDEAIVPIAEHLDLLKENKSIYLWFMKRDFYQPLSKYFVINPTGMVYSKVAEGSMHDLVYAEGRESRPDTEDDLFKQRTEYHIADTPATESGNVNLLKSTLRSTIACLINDDIAKPNVIDEVSLILEKYFIVYRISYAEIEDAACSIILQHENLIIEKLNPLFNIRSSTELELLPDIYSLLNERRLSSSINTIDKMIRERKEAMVFGNETEDAKEHYFKKKRAIYYWQGIHEMDI